MSRTPSRGDPASGDSVGPYALEEKLGEGGMGVVYRAVRQPGAEVVALKILRSELSGDEAYQQRFLREARVAGEIDDRHLVPIVEAGEADGRHYLATSYVDGRTLEDRIRSEGPLSLAEVVRLVAEIGSGLDALHRRSLVHRDVKPSNIMLRSDGVALLTDFGLATGRAYTVLTKPGQILGTLDYLAPELIKGEPADAASDIYALGCVVYECLTGGPPFGGRALFEVGVAHIEEEPADPSTSREDVPSWFGWAAMQALEKDPVRRPRTAPAYASMLRVAAERS